MNLSTIAARLRNGETVVAETDDASVVVAPVTSDLQDGDLVLVEQDGKYGFKKIVGKSGEVVDGAVGVVGAVGKAAFEVGDDVLTTLAIIEILEDLDF